MLQGIRKASQGWLGRTIITILFGLLIIAFGIWGIADIFRGYGRNTVAKVGPVEISADAVRNAYQNEIQRLSRLYRQSFTPDRARALGIDTQVLDRLVSDVALDQRIAALGLNVSNARIAQSIREEPAFSAAGQFDKARFDDFLHSSGYTEAGFVRDRRATILRQQVAEALAGGLAPPLVVREAIYRYGAERRSVNYFILPQSSAGTVGAPDDAALRAFFEERQASFRAPEYRKLAVLAVTPSALAKPEEISEAVVRERYERDKTSKYGAPEKRKLQQMGFPSEAEAQAASEKLKAGTSFEELAKERNIPLKDLELGTLTKNEVIDPVVRETAFSLPAGGVSAPVASRFGPVILRVDAIEPERVKPFEELAAELKRDLAVERARTAINAMHDKIEDQRAGAKTLQQIAPEFGLSVRIIDTVDRNGEDKTEKPVEGLPEETALLSAAFASDVGADNEAIRSADGGYVWFEVQSVEPARSRTLDEVRDAVIKAWRTDEISRRVAEKGRELVARLDKGDAFATVAADAGQEAKSADGLARGAAKGDLTSEAVTRIFGTFDGKAGTVALEDGESRLVFQVTAATMPAFDPKGTDAKGLDEELRLGMADDVKTEYIKEVEGELGVSVNRQALKTALGMSAEE